MLVGSQVTWLTGTVTTTVISSPDWALAASADPSLTRTVAVSPLMPWDFKVLTTAVVIWAVDVPVITPDRQPWRAAVVSRWRTMSPRPNSMMAKMKTNRRGATTANSTTAAPRLGCLFFGGSCGAVRVGRWTAAAGVAGNSRDQTVEGSRSGR